MTSISVRDFRSQLASSLNRVDAGERIVIHRNNRFYAIIPVDIETVTPRERTLSAIRETKSGKSAGKLNMDSFEDFLSSIDDSE